MSSLQATKHAKHANQKRDRRLYLEYGLLPGEYEALLAFQDNGCAICQRPPPKYGRRLAVDHQHVSGMSKRVWKSLSPKVKRSYLRGILCISCNFGLYRFKDSSAAMIRGSRYLLDPPAKQLFKLGDM